MTTIKSLGILINPGVYMRKFFAISIMLAVLLTMAACGEEPELIDNPNPAKPLENADNTVMEYEGESISAGLYSFIFSYQKTYFLYYYQNLGVSDIVEDTQAFWNTETPNGLLGETAVNDINNHCRMIVLCNKMAEEHDVELGDAELEYIAEELNDLISAYGSTEGLSDYLRRFGIDVDDVEEYFNDKYLILALQNELSKLSFDIEIEQDSQLIWEGAQHPIFEMPQICTYDDHRMAMAFAPAALYMPGLIIKDVEVVAKSYPQYWDHLIEAGFELVDASIPVEECSSEE